jgi:hypothetical protein
MDELESLRIQVAERDTVINTLKEKTKTYVQVLREEHATEIKCLQIKLLDYQKQLEQEKDFAAKQIKYQSNVAETCSNESIALTQANIDLTLKVSNMEREVQRFSAENRDIKLQNEKIKIELNEFESIINAKDSIIVKQSAALSQTLTEEVVHRQVQDLTSQHERALMSEKQILHDQHQRVVTSLREDYQENLKNAALRENSLKRQVLELESKLNYLTLNAEQSNSKIKAYIETLVADNDKLVAVCSSTGEERASLLSQSFAAKREFEVQNELNEKALLEKNVALDKLRSELITFQLTLQERDSQIAEHQKCIHLVTSELEDHKTKRLQARTEMIALAQQFEKTQRDLKDIKALLKRDISLIVSEHITCLESVLALLEIVNTQLSSSTSVATTSFSPLSSKKRNDNKEANMSQTVSASTDDVFQQLHLLRDQLVQANTGSMLLSHAVRRLQETASKSNEDSCCSAVLFSIRQKIGSFSMKGGRRDGLKNLRSGKYDRVIMDTSGGADSPRLSDNQSIHSKSAVEYAIDNI